MESLTDPWHINPADLLKANFPNAGNVYDDSCDMDNAYRNNNNDDRNGAPNMSLPPDDFARLLDINYEDVDHLLSQELKDLDIPIIPQGGNNADYYGNAPYDSSNIDCGQLSKADAYNIPKYSAKATHKRGPSGTAIFGFVNHNKTLSISNFQKSMYNLSSDSQPIFGLQEEETNSFRNETNPNENSLGQVLLKQQEDLRIALERQQEVNRKLEKQLQANKLQQEHLQRVLHEQEAVAHRLVPETSPPQSTRTPVTKNGRNDAIIITSNSDNGSYQFPPPSMISPPSTNTSINGSPSRRPFKGRTGITEESKEERVPTSSASAKFENGVGYNNGLSQYIHDFSTGGLDSNMDSTNSEKSPSKKRNLDLNYKNPFCPSDQSRSPISMVSPSHKKKESIISTVSTIPQHHEDNESSDTESGSLLGLGIQSINGKSLKAPRSYSLRPPPVDMLPPIPGSSDNTPAGKQTQLPQKHTFQHTPIKTQQQQQNIPSHTSTSVNEKLFKDTIGTPQLKPPSIPIIGGRRNSGYSSDYPGIDNGDELQQAEEPESRFIMARTPSPVLKSQGKFEGTSPHFELDGSNSGSPLKITRKPTTLPRGSIDRYVKELPDKLFQCMYPGCDKVFKRRYNIRSHIQTHLEDRPYVCDFEGCDKAFVRNHDLVRHKKSHAEKSYGCPCGKKFNREDALIVHRSRMICSGGKKYENIVIKKSPRKRGRPKKDGYGSVSCSPVKDTLARDNDGYLMFKMEEQLRNEMEKYGLLRPSLNIPDTNNSVLLSPSASSDHSDLSPRLINYDTRESNNKM